MPNWCSNEIIVTGPAADKAALHALIVKNHNVDFEVIAPVPAIFKPLVINDSKAAYEYNRVQPNRLGSLTPDAFIKRMAELHKTAIYNNIQHSEYDCYDPINTDFTSCREAEVVFVKDRSIEDSIELFSRSLWTQTTRQKTSEVGPIIELITKINHAMEKEYRDYRHELGYTESTINHKYNEWCRENWGTKWNADNDGMEDNGTCDDYFFLTANSSPIAWFNTLTERAGELNLQVEITMSYAEQGNWFGGVVVWLPNSGSPTETAMSDEDICDFLDIDLDD